ncbi:MAG: lamin tail domain-containing protein [Planctomycetota bacterium]|nr:lamin tail domain-containing protein [Planctomycetota bacterium]
MSGEKSGLNGKRFFQPAARRLGWLALVGAISWVLTGPVEARILIAEIHYNPAGPGDRLEFVELFNDEPLPFDISDYRFTAGVDYVFPRGTVVGARDVIVVARDPAFLAAEHGVDLPLGPFQGRLDNGGEELVLVDTGGSVVARVPYNDRGRWPAAPDGAGPSLVLRDEFLDPTRGESWGWSVARGGTPGAVSFETVEPEVLLNEAFRGDGESWVELFNPSSSPLDLSGYLLAGDPSGSPGYTLRAGSVVPAAGFLTLTAGNTGLVLDAREQYLLLQAPDRRVVDACRLRERPEEGSDGRLPDGVSRWLRTSPPSPGAANVPPPRPPLVISEIHYHPYSDDDAEEFLELANIGDAPLDLSGFELTGGVDFVFPEATTLGVGEYLVVAKDPVRLQEVQGISGVLGAYDGVLADSGETVRLRNAHGDVVDEVRYFDDGSWPRWADGDGPSLERVDLRQDGSVGAAWRESDHASASRWFEYEYTGRQARATDSEFHLFLLGAGEVLLDDIEVVPVAGGENHLPNGTFDGERPLVSWRIEGTHVDSDVALGAGPDGSNALRVVASKRGDTRANRLEIQTRPALRFGMDYTVRFKARWLRGSDLIMTRSWGHGLARVTRLDVPPRGGTPGRANSRAAPDAGPLIRDVEQEPALPAVDSVVTLRARVSDPDGVVEVMLHHRLQGEQNFRMVPMTDDGEGPDRLAGDGSYAVSFDAAGRRGGVAEFYIEARDAGGMTRALPPGAPEEPFVFQFDDGVRPAAIPAYRVVMRARNLQVLRGRSPFSNHLLSGSLVVGSEHIFHGGGIRYRGSPFLRRNSVTGMRKGLRVRLGDENPLQGAVRIVLDEQAVDSTLQVDRLVRHFLQKAGGIPYGERRHVNLILAGQNFGVYEQVLAVDQGYLKRSFGETATEGELYKIDAHYEITDQGEFAFPAFMSWKYTDNPEDLRFTYKKRSREKEDDFSSLMSLLDLMDVRRTDDEAFDTRAPELIDLDAWVKGIAVYRAVEDWDAIGGWTGKNVYLYRDPAGLWHFIPWDHDVALGSAALQGDQNARAYLYTPYFPEIRRLLERPQLDRKFIAELARLFEEDYNPAVVDPVLQETWGVIRRTIGVSSPARLQSFMRTRRSFILSRLPPSPDFAIETNAGEPFTTSESPVTLRGKAPYDIETITIGASVARVSWPDRETWEIRVPLSRGVNDLRLRGFDGRAELIATASVEVTFAPPEAAFLRGDVLPDGRLNISDAVAILRVLFLGRPTSCRDAADADDSGALNITDAIFLLRYLFGGGSPPPPPFPVTGLDPTPDDLNCS